MKLAAIWRDERGTSALEFALTAPAFFLFLFGIIELGLMFWTQIGIQHGAEMAARCATINATLCATNNPSTITSYATQQSFGLTLPANTFTYGAAACGNQVTGSYTFAFPEIMSMGPLTLTAQACFPA